MMKKALSLLLALAMVMSMFTVGAFADTDGESKGSGTEDSPYNLNWVDTDNRTGYGFGAYMVTTLTVDGEAELSAPSLTNESGIKGDFTDCEGTLTATYAWSITSGSDCVQKSGSGDKITVKAKKVGSATIKLDMTVTGTKKVSAADNTEDEDESTTMTRYYSGTCNYTVEDAQYRLVLTESKSAQTMKLTTSATGDLTLTANDVQFQKKNEDGEWADNSYAVSSSADSIRFRLKETAATAPVTYTWSDGSDADNTKVTAKSDKTGTATIEAFFPYHGKTYTVTVCNITVLDYAISDSVVNGSSKSYTAKALAEKIAANIASVATATTGTTVASSSVSISEIKLEIPAYSSNNRFVTGIYYGTGTSATGAKKWLSSDTGASSTTKVELTIPSTDISASSQTNKLILTTRAGTVDSTGIAIQYEAKAKIGDGTEQTVKGTLTLTSAFYSSTAETDTQYADFTKEEFYLDSISGFSYVQPRTSSKESYSTYSDSAVTSISGYLIDDDDISATSDWTMNFIGYSSSHVAYKLDVTFKAKNYDIQVSGDDGSAPFKFSDFESFTSAVAKEQNGRSYYTDLQYVQFTTTSFTGLKLKDGSSTLATYGNSSKLGESDLESVTLDITTVGTYSIPFTVGYKYKTSSSGSWSSSTANYSGILRLYATGEGDIQYEVSYSDKVTFSAADFLSYYRSVTKSTATLTSVTFDDGQPSAGTLYTVANKTSSGYKVTNSNTFKYDPSTNDYDLGKVTYVAASTPKTEYSVFIPFTARGSQGSKSGVVEIVVNGSLPFTDVKTTDTFYEYIRYCYRNGLMTGTTGTTFGASSSITRQQLALVLYRIAGSPTTYNNKTLAFSDCKSLGAESQAALKWAVNTGVITGYSNGTFQPKSAVTRQAMLTMVYRFAKVKGVDTSVYSSSLNSFKDAAKVSPNMKTAVNWAVENGLVGGNNGYLAPQGTTTRGAAAKILANFHSYYMA